MIVYGVASDTHFAHVMVKADYDLKSISNGSDRIEGVISLKNLHRRVRKELKEEGDALGRQGLIQNRFWFNPGDPAFYRQDDHGSVISGMPRGVEDRRGSVDAAGASPRRLKARPSGQGVRREFTAAFKEIARRRPSIASWRACIVSWPSAT